MADDAAGMAIEIHISPEQRASVVDALRRLGVSEVAKRLGLSNESVLRLAHDHGSQAGTEALAASRLERLAG